MIGVLSDTKPVVSSLRHDWLNHDWDWSRLSTTEWGVSSGGCKHELWWAKVEPYNIGSAKQLCSEPHSFRNRWLQFYVFEISIRLRAAWSSSANREGSRRRITLHTVYWGKLLHSPKLHLIRLVARRPSRLVYHVGMFWSCNIWYKQHSTSVLRHQSSISSLYSYSIPFNLILFLIWVLLGLPRIPHLNRPEDFAILLQDLVESLNVEMSNHTI
jgi:hypothetical protein